MNGQAIHEIRYGDQALSGDDGVRHCAKFIAARSRMQPVRIYRVLDDASILAA
jgi:hypothetical protein